MLDAWIYVGSDEDEDADTARVLAELGFSPRRIQANGSLRPDGGDGGAARRPAVAIVLAGAADNGWRAVCSALRDDEDLGGVPVILAVGQEQLATSGTVEIGDELIVRPFDAGELQARIARARRSVNGVESDDVVRMGTLEINLATYQVSVAGGPVDFTYMEYELLKFLATHPNRVFSREALLSAVWGYDYYGGARTVDVHVRRVRAKLGSEHAARIKTVRSVGYRFEAGR